MADETKLLRRLQAHDERALEQCIQLYTPYLGTVIFRAVGRAITKEDSEEIASDVFVSIWQHASEIEDGHLRVYMAAAAKNLAYKRLRDRQSAVSLSEASPPEPAAPDPALLELQLWDCVRTLGDETCEIFLRYYKYTQSQWEISRAMHMPLSTVKTRLRRGREKLRTLFAEEEKQ